jgi:hypothetical protein
MIIITRFAGLDLEWTQIEGHLPPTQDRPEPDRQDYRLERATWADPQAFAAWDAEVGAGLVSRCWRQGFVPEFGRAVPFFIFEPLAAGVYAPDARSTLINALQ